MIKNNVVIADEFEEVAHGNEESAFDDLEMELLDKVLPDDSGQLVNSEAISKSALADMSSEVVPKIGTDRQDINIFDPNYVHVSVGSGGYKNIMTLKDFKSSYSPRMHSYQLVEILPVQENVVRLLKHYRLTLKYNVFTDMPDVYQSNGYAGTLDKLFVDILDKCTKQRFRISSQRLEQSLLSIAYHNQYNPIKDYIVNCYSTYKLDDHDYIGDLMDTLGTTLDEESKRLYLTKFLVQMATIGLCEDTDQIAAQFALVLQSKQGLGKTSWFKSLIPSSLNQHNNYFLESRIMDLNNKDHILEQNCSWLVEMGELPATLRKSDVEAIKAYITTVA